MTATIPELHVGDRLRITRDKAGVSRERMAREFHVTVGAVSQWENGRTQPRHLLEVVRKWAELTGFDYHWIAFGDSTSNNKCLDGLELAFSSQLELPLDLPEQAHPWERAA